MGMFPIVSFDEVSLDEANELLVLWKHRMGALERGNQGAWCYALYHEDKPVAVTTASYLIAANVGNLKHLTRDNTVELSRLCAVRPHLCRVALRCWREFVFPMLPFAHAISYQDADLHNGNTYRFDGWQRLAYSCSGPDTRSGRAGRKKWVWGWNCPPSPKEPS